MTDFRTGTGHFKKYVWLNDTGMTSEEMKVKLSKQFKFSKLLSHPLNLMTLNPDLIENKYSTLMINGDYWLFADTEEEISLIILGASHDILDD